MSEDRSAPVPQDRRSTAGTDLSFEEALARLEQIVRELEGSDLTLEQTLARYEEGSKLVRECTRRLEDAEQRIRVLSASRDADSARAGAARPGSGPAADRDTDETDASPDDELPF